MNCPVARWASLSPGRPALVFEGRTWSYRELDEEVRRWAAILPPLGIRRGDRVALLSTNRPELVALFHAIPRLGAVSAPLNVRLTPWELRPLVARLDPAVIIAEEQFAGALEDAHLLEKLGPEQARIVLDNSVPVPDLEPGATFAILFTSGTTGTPHAAELTVGNFGASARASGQNLGEDPDQRWLACLPLFHVGGLAMLTRCAIYGACLILHRQFREDDLNGCLDQGAVTHVSLVESTLATLLAARGGRLFPSTVRAVLVGGGPVSAEILEGARALHLPVLQTYGLTEATSQVATERIGRADGRTAGPALPGLEVCVLSSGGLPLPAEEVGEIHVRGPTVMRGYFRDERGTAEVLKKRWLRTRDIGSIDPQGRLRIFARRTDLIVSGGENIYPAEVEQVLKSHPGILQAAVIGEPQAHWGSVPIAAVVVAGAPLEDGELEGWCRARLAGFKIPKRFVRLDALPINATGKVDRIALAESLKQSQF